jgi:hypothetical protein
MTQLGWLEYGNSENGIPKFFRLQAFDIPQSRQKNICGNLERGISRKLQVWICFPSENQRGCWIAGVPLAVAETAAFPKARELRSLGWLADDA